MLLGKKRRAIDIFIFEELRLIKVVPVVGFLSVTLNVIVLHVLRLFFIVIILFLLVGLVVLEFLILNRNLNMVLEVVNLLVDLEALKDTPYLVDALGFLPMLFGVLGAFLLCGRIFGLRVLRLVTVRFLATFFIIEVAR